MLLNAYIAYNATIVPVGALILAISSLFYNRYCNGLNNIPGPFLASLTNVWRVLLVWKRRPEEAHRQLHDRYGEVVRLGPITVSISNWDAVKKIYGLKSGYTKSDFYPVQQQISNGRRLQNLFNTKDEDFHAKLRRSVANAFAMSTLVQFEPLVDSTITAFTDQLDQRFVDKPGPEGVLDFGMWLQYYAFDVIGQLTFSKRLGFVDEGRDVDNIISSLERTLDYVAVVGQIPWLDRLFVKNPVRLMCNDLGLINTTAPVVTFAKSHMKSRLAEDKSSAEQQERRTSKRPDFLARFLEANKKDPDFVDHQRVLSLTVTNVFAGSDTTGITLRAVFYYLMKNPTTLTKLRKELDSADLGPKESMVSWEQARNLPYLTAVIQESLRIHPAVGLPLERIVPPHGLAVNGSFIPPGTIVGASAWVLHAKESIFGAKPLEFRPERWIEASEEKRTEMNNALFTFGMGARTCIGKNISLLEMYKLVPTLLRRYELSFVDPDADWTLHNAWFVKQSGFQIRISRL